MDTRPEYLNRLNQLDWLCAGFVPRVEGVEVSTDREASIKALEPEHARVAAELGFSWDKVYRVGQVHGGEIADVDGEDFRAISPRADGLMTRRLGVMLGIYVADCGAIYVVDPKLKGIALLHSGRKGTELNILGNAVGAMRDKWGSDPGDLIVVLAPCIRPPHYEVDFAAEIKRQALAAGVLEENYSDCGICTGANVSEFYSYRVEKGNTGRMLALLGLRVTK